MITVILPVSRAEYLRAVFNCLAELEKPEDTELLIVIDGDSELHKKVDSRLDSINFSRTQVITFGNKPAEDINSRRFRISEIHNKASRHISPETDQVMLIEDDTTYPPDALTRLRVTMNMEDNCAFVTGVQLGRRNTPYLGAWKADKVDDPVQITSVMPSHGIQSIDAGGFYCALTDAMLYRMHCFEPYDQIGKVGLSCDVNYCFFLRRSGWDCYVDHAIQCDHIGDKGSVNLGNTIPAQVTFTKGFKNMWYGRRL